MLGLSRKERLQKKIEARDKKLAELKADKELYEKLNEQEQERKQILESPTMQAYTQAEQEAANKRIERNKKAAKILNIMTKHIIGDDEQTNKKKGD